MSRIPVTVLLFLILQTYSAAQFFSTRPFEATAAPTGSSFHDLLIAMSGDSTALHVHPVDERSLALGNEINFTYNYGSPSFFVDSGLWSAGLQFASGNAINFIKTENVPSFEVRGIVEIGYIGGIRSAGTDLYLRTSDDFTDLGSDSSQYFLYSLDSILPGREAAYSIRIDSGSGISYLQFGQSVSGHDSLSVLQDNPARFSIYSAINPDGSKTGEYLIGVAEEDDGLFSGSGVGFFYMSGSLSSPAVPEPSSMALVFSLIMGSIVGIRRIRSTLSGKN